MSRSQEDLELATLVMRDCLTEAIEIAQKHGERDAANRWRDVVLRMRDDVEWEWNPPFGESARQRAWEAWQAAHIKLGRRVPSSRIDVGEFRDWWMRNAEDVRRNS